MPRHARWSLAPLLAAGCFFNPTSAMTGASEATTTTTTETVAEVTSGSTGEASAADATLPTTTGETTAGASCGDFKLDEGEDCDNGANNNGGGALCRADCTFNVCGDDYLAMAVEGCDDGNTEDGDGCSSTCTIEGCGDGNQAGEEECDDGNNTDDDGCSNLCKLPVCGDSIKNGNEACDDGNNTDEDGCTNACKTPVCGDGIVSNGEACDDGNAIDDDACSNACALASCGDGTVQVNEQCDDGNAVDTDDCTASCKHAVCGDGIVATDKVSAPEECDDGNSSDGDGCSMACRFECGDGDLDPGEECDDGNLANNDTCANCTRLAYWFFVTSTKYTASQVQSLAAADAECTARAAGQITAGKYKAWLSDFNVGATSRLVHVDKPYLMPGGVVVEEGWAGLTDGTILNKLTRTENGAVVADAAANAVDCAAADALVWTSTNPDGSKIGTANCASWTYTKSDASGRLGLLSMIDGGWTNACLKPCTTAARLYCIEQP